MSLDITRVPDMLVTASTRLGRAPLVQRPHTERIFFLKDECERFVCQDENRNKKKRSPYSISVPRVQKVSGSPVEKGEVLAVVRHVKEIGAEW